MNYKLNGLLFNNGHLLNLTRSEYWTLHAICSYMNEKTGACFPTTEQIATTSRVYYRCVIAAIKSLEKKGFIRTEQKQGCRRNFFIDEEKFIPRQDSAPLQESAPLPKTTPLLETAPLLNIAPVPLLKTTGDPCEKTHPSPAKNSTRTEYITEKKKENTNREEVGRSDKSDAPLLTPTEPVTSSPIKKANGKNKQLTPLVTKVDVITEVPLEWKVYCAKRRPDLDIEKTFIDFVGYYSAKGERKKFSNWTLTWQRWVRNEHVTLATIYANEQKQVEAANGSSEPEVECPFGEIMGLYRLELPSLPQMEMVTYKVRENTKVFWKTMLDFSHSKDKEQGLIYVQMFFQSVAKTDFLMGRGNSKQTWRANFGWLVDPENTANIINGIYEAKKQ